MRKSYLHVINPRRREREIDPFVLRVSQDKKKEREEKG